MFLIHVKVKGCIVRKGKTCNVDVIIKDRVHIIGQQDRITDKTGRRKKKQLRKKIAFGP